MFCWENLDRTIRVDVPSPYASHQNNCFSQQDSAPCHTTKIKQKTWARAQGLKLLSKLTDSSPSALSQKLTASHVCSPTCQSCFFWHKLDITQYLVL